MNTITDRIEERIEAEAREQVQAMLNALWFAAGKILSDAGLPHSDHGSAGHSLQRALLGVYGASGADKDTAQDKVREALIEQRREQVANLILRGA